MHAWGRDRMMGIRRGREMGKGREMGTRDGGDKVVVVVSGFILAY